MPTRKHAPDVLPVTDVLGNTDDFERENRDTKFGGCAGADHVVLPFRVATA